MGSAARAVRPGPRERAGAPPGLLRGAGPSASSRWASSTSGRRRTDGARKIDPEVLAHLEWLGFVQPTGLVVSAPALVRAGAVLDRRDAEGQRLLANCTAERTVDPEAGPEPYRPDFEPFARSVLGWSFSPKFYAGTEESPLPPELEVALPEFEETLRPDFAVREPEPDGDGLPWQLLVQVLETGEDFDAVHRGAGEARGVAARSHGAAAAQTGSPPGCSSTGPRCGSSRRPGARARAGSTSGSPTC